MRDHLAGLLDDFRCYGRAVAVVRYQGNRRRVTTYGEIASFAGRFAALLVERGIGPGDRVLLWAGNSAEWIATFPRLPLARSASAVPLDANGTADFAQPPVWLPMLPPRTSHRRRNPPGPTAYRASAINL